MRGNSMDALTETDPEYWRDVVVGRGFTAIPRWSLDPKPGTAEHEAKIPGDLIATLRRLASELNVPLSSVLLAAHAKVLSVLSGEREVATAYSGETGVGPLPCRLTTEAQSWRELVLDTHNVEVQLLSRAAFPLDELRRELGV